VTDLTVTKPQHTQKQARPTGTNETGTIGSTKKIDLMVERGKEGTRINRFNSSEPDRFIHGYKCSKSVQNFIIPLPLSLFKIF
jgi:hypothetical protein